MTQHADRTGASGALSTERLSRWCDAEAAETPRALVVAAHPDDDVLGVGGQLCRRASRVHVAIVSDGAPAAPRFYRSLGFESRAEYARVRRAEAAAALRLAGVPDAHVVELGLLDQAVARDLISLVPRLAQLIAAVNPDVVLTHPYEGGHPDHDATACAVHAALHAVSAGGSPCPVLLEFTSYHARGAGLVFGEFLPEPGLSYRTLELNAEARRCKRALLECHATQRAVWQAFPLDQEQFRVAPRYDFRAPPAAAFHYDRVDWGMSGRELLDHLVRCLDARDIQERI